MDWIQSHSAVIQAGLSLGTLMVWVFYAQLLLAGFKRQRKARILINQGWGNQINSVCLVGNMSQEAIYIQCVFISLRTGLGRYRSSITDFDDVEPWNSQNQPGEITRQGPLQSGCYLNLGTFRTLIRQAAEQHGLSVDECDPMGTIDLRNFQITVVCGYGPEGEAIGVQRSFLISGTEDKRMRPASIYSQRITSRQARRKMERWLQEAM